MLGPGPGPGWGRGRMQPGTGHCIPSFVLSLCSGLSCPSYQPCGNQLATPPNSTSCSICTAQTCLSAALYPHQTSFPSPFLSLSHHVISLIPPTNTMEGTSARQTFICVEMVPKMTRFRKPDYTPPQCVTVQYQPGQARASLSACACDREHVTCGPGCG